MFKLFLKYGLFLVAALGFGGCRQNLQNSDKLVAEVGNKKLYLSELSAVIPNELDKTDSIVMAEEYIRKWIREELMLLKAEENLSFDLKDVTRELEEYRNSLIIFRYKNELLAQRMDTTVSDNEIMEYYLEHAENFKLNRDIVKAAYIRIPAELANPDLLKEMSSNSTEEGINELRYYCLQYAKGFDIFTDRWVELDRVMVNIPTTIENPEQFLKKNQFLEYNDSSYYYLVTIHDYLLRNEQAPEDYVRNDIKSLILNRRKIEFLKDLENNIFQEGINRNSFKIYNIETNEM
jgi:hypothetical protein